MLASPLGSPKVSNELEVFLVCGLSPGTRQSWLRPRTSYEPVGETDIYSNRGGRKRRQGYQADKDRVSERARAVEW